MSYPYPQDRNRDRKEKGEQPYKDAREAMAESEERLQAEAEAFGEEHLSQTNQDLAERLQADAVERLREVGADRERSPAAKPGSTSD
jgi:hypothetical protein